MGGGGKGTWLTTTLINWQIYKLTGERSFRLTRVPLLSVILGVSRHFDSSSNEFPVGVMNMSRRPNICTPPEPLALNGGGARFVQSPAEQWQVHYVGSRLAIRLVGHVGKFQIFFFSAGRLFFFL